MNTGDDRDRTDRFRAAHSSADDAGDRETADALRRALVREAARVVPSGDGLERIRARTVRTRRHTSWLVPLAAAAASVAVIGGAGWLVGQGVVDAPWASDDEPVGVASATGPVGGNPITLPSSAPEGTAVALPVYYVGAQAGDGSPDEYRLFREFHPTTTAESPDAETRVELALREMFAASASDPDYDAAVWPARTQVTSVSIDERLITVDLSGLRADELSSGPFDPRAAVTVQQLVFTATAAASIGAGVTDATFDVQLLVDGEPVDHVLGTPTAKPLGRDTAASRAAVWILSIEENDTLTNPVTVSGEAYIGADGEGGWELLRDGVVLTTGDVETAECCVWAPFTVVVDDETLAPGRYELRVFVRHGDDPDSILSDTKSFNIEGPAA